LIDHFFREKALAVAADEALLKKIRTVCNCWGRSAQDKAFAIATNPQREKGGGSRSGQEPAHVGIAQMLYIYVFTFVGDGRERTKLINQLRTVLI